LKIVFCFYRTICKILLNCQLLRPSMEKSVNALGPLFIYTKKSMRWSAHRLWFLQAVVVF